MNPYCESLTSYKRGKTIEVPSGDLPCGGDNPNRIQSMTIADTRDTGASVEQAIRMIEAGCEYARITAPSVKEAENVEHIKKELRRRGYAAPLIAEIHFTPNAAMLAARIAEKVRINPGNYADKKRFETMESTDSEYQAELERIYQKFSPLVKICKEYGTAMRIGTNHGSLSDRIMNRYGDTPLGMAESALEFVRICEDLNYYRIVLSMKSSNPQVMVQAYRLLTERLIEEKRKPYPLHLGVTEAGDGLDGRIKSALGIGTLLEGGLGDSIRVSATEEPEGEIPVPKMLAGRNARRSHKPTKSITHYPVNPYQYNRRTTKAVLTVGGLQHPCVMIDLSEKEKVTPATLFALDYKYSVPSDKWTIGDRACDYIYLGKTVLDFEIPGTLGAVYDYETWLSRREKEHVFPIFTTAEFKTKKIKSTQLNFVRVTAEELTSDFIEEIKKDPSAAMIMETHHPHAMPDLRQMFVELMNSGCETPALIHRRYEVSSAEELAAAAAIDAGALLIDGMGDGIFISCQNLPPHKVNEISFGILQAARMRISKTEFISCPSCGRTLFDLQKTTAMIRARTGHLKGVKIAIMGCIVNGPGEMADADYGYVGAGPDRITLYKGKEAVKKNLRSSSAAEHLIDLIRNDGRWIEKTEK